LAPFCVPNQNVIARLGKRWLLGADAVSDEQAQQQDGQKTAERVVRLAIRRRPDEDGGHAEFLGGQCTRGKLCAISPGELQQVLVTVYAAGAVKDRAVFGDVVGISLLTACTFRLRRKT
jgi:hypothetical protein